jgi:HEPN superfamily RES-like protein
VIDDSAEVSDQCSFCGARPAANIDILIGAFVDGLRNEFVDADDQGIYYDGREGGYQWDEIWDTWDLVTEEFGHLFAGDGLLETVRSAIDSRMWVLRDPAWPRQDEALLESWERFCEIVQYEIRYVFWLHRYHDAEELRRTGQVPPAESLTPSAS